MEMEFYLINSFRKFKLVNGVKKLLVVFSSHRMAVLWLPSFVALLLAVLPSLLGGVPAPMVHDERGYLLAAETFSDGHLTNPAHPHWPHFETIHQLQQPSYSGMYPPMQSAFLAIGQLLGDPIIGVWLSVLLMVAAISWMLSGYFNRYWSLVGGLVAVLQLVVLGEPFGQSHMMGYWSQSYWGGAVAAAGGALVLGALPRLVSKRQFGWSPGLCLGIGLALMGMSRPKEGLIVALPVAVVLLFWLIKNRTSSMRYVALYFIAPVSGFVLAILLATTMHNKAVTGVAMKTPWQAHYEQYVVFPLFLWQQPTKTVKWNNPQLERFHGEWELDLHRRSQTTAGFIDTSLRKVARYWLFYLGPVLTLPLLLSLCLLRNWWVSLAAVICLLIQINNLLSFAAFPHYAAPATGALYLLVVAGLRYGYLLLRNTPRIGQGLIPFILVAGVGFSTYGVVKSAQGNAYSNGLERHRISQQLEELSGTHLVMIRYGAEHNVHDEWVFNQADIDHAKVVWARELTPKQNQQLLTHYSDRSVWLIKVGFAGEKAALTAYTPVKEN